MNLNRRDFLRGLGLSALALVTAPFIKLKEAVGAIVEADKIMVNALGYVDDAKKSKDRKDKKAFCKNCNFYQGDEKSKQAKCQLFTGGSEVQAEGWCKSWSAKPKDAKKKA